MAELKNIIDKLLTVIEDKVDLFTFNLRKRMGFNNPIQIVPYRSYGTQERLYIKGRVLEENGLTSPVGKDSILTNILQMYERFQSNEVPGVLLKVNFHGKEYEVNTDKEGYFTLNLYPNDKFNLEDIWQEVEIEIVSSPLPHVAGLKTIAEVLVPPLDAEYGIISDIDDTVIKTNATSLLAMAGTVFLHNAHSKLPFAGVSEFYKALQLGRNGKRNNPFFYVSSSPWNLYDLLIDFLDLNNIPPGPLLLRDFGFNNEIASGDHMGHKFKEIENILRAYPHLNFVLIGDSGQEDPVIYQEVVKKYPDRILAIYIRDVQSTVRERIAMDIAKNVVSQKVDMLVVDNTVEAAEHAAKIKLIFTEAIPEIVEDKKLDKGEKPGKEDVLSK